MALKEPGLHERQWPWTVWPSPWSGSQWWVAMTFSRDLDNNNVFIAWFCLFYCRHVRTVTLVTMQTISDDLGSYAYDIKCPCHCHEVQTYPYRGVLVSVNFGCFSLHRLSHFHCNAMRKAIKVHKNLYANQQNEHTPGLMHIMRMVPKEATHSFLHGYLSVRVAYCNW